MPPSTKDFPDKSIRIAEALERFRGKWEARILYILLQEGSLSFSDLRERIPGISGKVLSEKLDSLEERGLVREHEDGYRLTDAGNGLEPAFQEILDWSKRNIEGVELAVYGSPDLVSAVEDLTEPDLDVRSIQSPKDAAMAAVVLLEADDDGYVLELAEHLAGEDKRVVAIADRELELDVDAFDSRISKPLTSSKISRELAES